MTGVLHVTVDGSEVSLAEAIAEAARVSPFLVLTSRLFADLADELGSNDAATRHLILVATATNKPLAVNVEREGGESTTAVISPRAWTRERLHGWVAGKADAMSALFGDSKVREP